MRRRDLLLSTAAFGAAALARAGVNSNKLKEAEGLLTAAEDRISSSSLTVTQANKVVASRGPKKVYLLASISKPMTATGVMLLSDRGELSIEDPVHKFIPEFTEGDRKLITIRHLLTHTSGLPDQLPENAELRKSHAPLSEFVKLAIRTPLKFKPGTEYSYQSMGILLASEVAQRITGKPFPDYMVSEVFGPLGMKDTSMNLGKHKLADTQQCQVEFSAPEAGAGSADSKSWDWNSPYWRNLGSPWGGAHSTSTDVTTFLQSFLYPDGKVLKVETAQSMIRNHTEGLDRKRGLGFQLGDGFGDSCSEQTFGHGGSTGTLCWCDPTKELACVILTTLPARVSSKLVLQPVSDLVSESV